MKKSTIRDIIGFAVITATAAAITYAFTPPSNNPEVTDYSPASLIYQMAGTGFTTTEHSLHSISCSLQPWQPSC